MSCPCPIPAQSHPNISSASVNVSTSQTSTNPPIANDLAGSAQPQKKKRDKGAFKFKHFTIRHDLCGMKVGTDAVLLTGYASLDNTKPNGEVWGGNVVFNENEHLTEDFQDSAASPRRILEIGCGSGVITLLLTNRYKNAIVDSIDIDEGAIKQALFNIQNCPIPSVQSRVRLFHCPAQEFTSPPLNPALYIRKTSTNNDTDKTSTNNDTNEPTNNGTDKELSDTKEQDESEGQEEERDDDRDKQENLNSLFQYLPSFDSMDSSDGIYDLIICAPPYFKSDESTDMILRMKNKRRIARHTHTLLMEELAGVVRTMLKKDSGQFKTIFSLPYPADVFQKAAPEIGLQCVEKVHVRDNPKDNPVRLMETYIAPLSLPKNTTTSTTTQSTTDESKPTNDDEPKPMNDDESKPTTNDESTNKNPGPASDFPPAIERQFSIYTASYKEMPLMHRPYTNQYKFLVKDFCVHFLNK